MPTRQSNAVLSRSGSVYVKTTGTQTEGPAESQSTRVHGYVFFWMDVSQYPQVDKDAKDGFRDGAEIRCLEKVTVDSVGITNSNTRTLPAPVS
uniref:Uncharacterized protein n=1 Tax=Oryza sativa subsp. japonica TaxID=39947 RepID=Q6K5G4_ORYSJ|nr:hypothetical protein [Oryza sativa Japonica Group]BAD22161.1 hypothetical protein [Oryza sativa Japonica Group]